MTEAVGVLSLEDATGKSSPPGLLMLDPCPTYPLGSRSDLSSPEELSMEASPQVGTSLGNKHAGVAELNIASSC